MIANVTDTTPPPALLRTAPPSPSTCDVVRLHDMTSSENHANYTHHSIDVIDSDAEERDTFEQLAREWKRNRKRGMDLDDMIMDSAYQRIVGMGKPAIRYLLERLADKPDHWFWALFAITGDNPVRPEHEGRLAAMADAWIGWGRKRGYAV